LTMSEQDVGHYQDPFYAWSEPSVKRWREKMWGYYPSAGSILSSVIYEVRPAKAKRFSTFSSHVTRYLTMKRLDSAVRTYDNRIAKSREGTPHVPVRAVTTNEPTNHR
jgi:hypothetical protein